MAAPLDRTWFNTLIDDDGSGTTGTIWNKPQIDGLLDTVDGSLAGLVDKIGTPALNQLAIFNDADTVKGAPELTTPGGASIKFTGDYAQWTLIHPSAPADQRRWTCFTDGINLAIVTETDAGQLQTNTFGLSREGVLYLRSGRMNFPATQIPSGDPYTLDDYREGDWTPTLSGQSGGSGQTYATRVGTYVKCGRFVLATVELILATKGTISGAVTISLPFPCRGPAGGGWTFTSSPIFFNGLATNWVSLYGVVYNSVDYMVLQGSKVAGPSNNTSLLDADMGNSSQFYFSIAYLANQ